MKPHSIHAEPWLIAQTNRSVQLMINKMHPTDTVITVHCRVTGSLRSNLQGAVFMCPRNKVLDVPSQQCTNTFNGNVDAIIMEEACNISISQIIAGH